MPKKIDRSVFLDAIRAKFGATNLITREQVVEICNDTGMTIPAWITNDPARRTMRGVYNIQDLMNPTASPAIILPIIANPPAPAVKPVKAAAKVAKVAKAEPLAPAFDASTVPVGNVVDTLEANFAMSTNTSSAPLTEGNLVPAKATGYVPFGHFADIRTIIGSKIFYPTFITGLSGNGKTMMVEQICALENRECVRVNVTRETDEDDLIGGFRLIDGHTVWQNGPVVVAMERGAILLLDEVDLGDAKLMCLQPVLEGKQIYLKKVNKVVRPAPGFTVVATANTKGKGSDDGRFIGTNVLNEAFLERFSVTFEQEYPGIKAEERILNNVLTAKGITDKDFTSKLVQWADVTRKSYMEGAVSEIISTRRLVHIIEAFAIFGQNRLKAIKLCLNRFDEDTKKAFLELYEKLDEKATTAVKPPATEQETETAF